MRVPKSDRLRRVSAMVASAGLCVLLTGNARAQESPPLVVDPEAKGYVVIPLTPRADGALMFTAKLGGRDLDLKLDLTNKVSVFKKRTLDKLEISLEKTTVRIPTQRGDRRTRSVR